MAKLLYLIWNNNNNFFNHSDVFIFHRLVQTWGMCLSRACGSYKTDPSRSVCQPLKTFRQDYHEEEEGGRKKMRQEDNFPWGNFSPQYSNRGRGGSWGDGGVRKWERRRRAKRPNRGKGLAQTAWGRQSRAETCSKSSLSRRTEGQQRTREQVSCSYSLEKFQHYC